MKVKQILFLLISVLVFVLSFVLFHNLIVQRIPTDFNAHISFAIGLNKGGMIPNPLFYMILNLFVSAGSDFSAYFKPLKVILSLAVMFKFIITFLFIKFKLNKSYYLSLIISFLLLISHSILFFTKHNYLGNFTSNVWHNSTTIFVFPFSLLLFWLSYNFLISKKYLNNNIFLILVLILLNLVSKPSFLLIFLVAFPLMSLKLNGINKTFLKSLIPIVFTCFLIGLQYFIIYETDNDYAKGSVVIDPFFVWDNFSESKLISTLVSFVFPIVMLLFYGKTLVKDNLWLYSFVLLIISILVFIFFKEDGERALHGNFLWQIFIAQYIFFMVSSKFLIRFFKKKKESLLKFYTALFAFLIHSVSGVLYIYYIFKDNSFF